MLKQRKNILLTICIILLLLIIVISQIIPNVELDQKGNFNPNNDNQNDIINSETTDDQKIIFDNDETITEEYIYEVINKTPLNNDNNNQNNIDDSQNNITCDIEEMYLIDDRINDFITYVRDAKEMADYINHIEDKLIDVQSFKTQEKCVITYKLLITKKSDSNDSINDTQEQEIKDIITLSRNNINLQVGDYIDLQANIKYGISSPQTFKWLTENSDLISIVGYGTNIVWISAKKSGTAVVEIKTASGASAKCIIYISDKPKIDSISLLKHDISLNIDEYFRLSDIVNGFSLSKNITWTSNNENILIIDSNNVIVPKSVGSTTITAKLGNATENVSVTVKPKQVKKVNITGKSYISVGKSADYYVTIEPTNATNKEVKWESLTPNVATVDDNGHVTAINPGKAQIQVMANNGTKSIKEIEVHYIKEGKDEFNKLICDSEGIKVTLLNINYNYRESTEFVYAFEVENKTNEIRKVYINIDKINGYYLKTSLLVTMSPTSSEVVYNNKSKDYYDIYQFREIQNLQIGVYYEDMKTGRLYKVDTVDINLT